MTSGRPSDTRVSGEKAKIGMVHEVGGIIQLVPMSLIDPSPFQTRFDSGGVEELAENIKAVGGLIHPISLRPKPDGRYEIIHGHRRFRAFQMLGKNFIPAVIRELDDEATFILLGSENIQRRNFSPIEEARYYLNFRIFLEKRLNRKVTLDELERRLGQSKQVIRARIALLDLPQDIQEKIHRGEIPVDKAGVLTRLVHLSTAEKTDRWLRELRRIAEEIEKAERKPLSGLKTVKAVAHAVRRIQEGASVETAIEEGKIIDATEAMKRQISKIDPKEVLVRIEASQPSEEDFLRLESQTNAKLVRQMLEKGVLRCPFCGGDDLVWKCTGKEIGEEEEKQHG